jgi:hypothetical protein
MGAIAPSPGAPLDRRPDGVDVVVILQGLQELALFGPL